MYMKWTPKIGQVDKLRIEGKVTRNPEAVNDVQEA